MTIAVTPFAFKLTHRHRTLWVAAVLSHMIEPNVPGGQWTTSCAANSYGHEGTINDTTYRDI